MSAPRSLSRLGPIEWAAERHYRMLGYYFTIRSNSNVVEEPHRLIARFEVPDDPREVRIPETPNVPPVYSVVELGTRAKNRFRLFFGDEQMVIGSLASQATDHLLWHVHTEALRQTGDFLLVHAGAVRTPSGKGMLLPAEAGSGKSTLTLGLVRAGFGYLSDEAAVIDPVTRMLHPFPKAITLKSGSFGLFPEHARQKNNPAVWAERHILPEDIRPNAVARECPIGFVVSPRFEAGGELKLERVSRATAVTELWRHGFNTPLYGKRAPLLLASALEQARCFRLTFDDLDEAVAALGSGRLVD